MPLRHSSWKEHLLAKSNSVEGLTGNENFGSFPAATAKTTIQADALLKNLTDLVFGIVIVLFAPN